MTSALRKLTLELREDIKSSMTIPAFSAGFTSGVGLLVAQIAFGSFIFSGALNSFSSQGIGLILFGNFAACLIVAITSGYRGAIAGLSPALVVIMATIASAINAEGEAMFVNAVAIFVVSAMAIGLSFILIGRYQMSNVVRFIPYPVAAGFVAGIGGIVCFEAVKLMIGEQPGSTFLKYLEPGILMKWVPGTLFGVALYYAMKNWRNMFILPVSVAIAISAYHLILNELDISGDAARQAGLLLRSTADGSLWPSVLPADFVHLDWIAIVDQMPNIMTLMLIAVVSVIMNVAGLELAVDQELDWNKEFKSVGIASMVSGLGGGTVATLVVPASLRSKLFGATTRLTGLFAAAVIGVALVFGDGMLEFIPTALVGGMLVFAGIGMLDNGLVRSRQRVPWSEYSIILLIFLIIVGIGLIEGVVIGMLASVIFFVVRLSRESSIIDNFNVRNRHSNKVRSIPDQAILLSEGGRAQVFLLGGYVFFGNIVPLVSQLRESLETHRPICLMLDFSNVSGFGYSAVITFSRFLQSTNSTGVKLVLSGMSERLNSDLERNLSPEVLKEMMLEQNTDHGLERCEDIILSELDTNVTRDTLMDISFEDMERSLEHQTQFEDLVEELEQLLPVREYSAEERIASSDELSNSVQLLVSGKASAYDVSEQRIHQFNRCEVIRQVSRLDQNAAFVMADEPCRVLDLTSDDRCWLEEHHAELALKLYRYLFAKIFHS